MALQQHAAEQPDADRLEISAPDREDLEVLYDELLVKPGIDVEMHSITVPGDQGSGLELLTLALSDGGLAALLKLLTVLAESRGPQFKLRIRRGRDKVDLTADNAEEALEALREILNGK